MSDDSPPARTPSRRDAAERLRAIMDREGETVGEHARTVNQVATYSIEHLESYEDFRTAAREIKEAAIANLPELIDHVQESVEANGGHVYLAKDARAANEYVESVLDANDAERLVKSKSMTTEEIGVNDHLASAGVDVFETDLGEFVVQVADEAPSHLIGPAMHKTPEDIAELFNEELDPATPLSGDPHELTEFAREYVGDQIRRADAGMTGANFVVAESGSIALVTNEGNARKSAVTPPTHIAVTGIEKIVPTLADLQPFVELIARTGTGQDITSYVSLLSPPVDTPTVDFEADQLGDADERDFHLVLVDNGRMAMREDDDLRETLYCIRCGACANTCANFQAVGGHAFGGETYTGGIGTGWEAGVHGLDSAGGFNDLCTGCSRCVEKCPTKVDIPWINTVVRDRINREADPGDFDFLVEGLTPDDEPAGMDRAKRLFGNVERVAKWGSATAPVSNWIARSSVGKQALDWLVGVDPRRDLPPFAGETFVEWFAKRGSSVGESGSSVEREVVLYPDLYTNYFLPDRGKATVRVLEALGCRVHVPPVGESGRGPLSQGMVETARGAASEVYSDLVEHLDAGRDVVVVEPSDLAMFRSEYEHLLPADSFSRLAEHSYEVTEYVYGLLENGGDPADLGGPAESTADGEDGHRADVTYHGHCQAQTLDLVEYGTAVLEAAGYDVRETTAECCGMAGSFGYKSEYYEVSQAVGEHLAESVDDDRLVTASGASCHEQLADFLASDVPHPVELVDPSPPNDRTVGQ